MNGDLSRLVISRRSMDATTMPGDAVRGIIIAKGAIISYGGSSTSVKAVGLGLV